MLEKSDSEESYKVHMSNLPSMGRRTETREAPKEADFVKDWKPKTPPSIQIEDTDDRPDRRIPERPSDKKPADRPQSKYQRPSDTKPAEQQPERPKSMRPSDKKPHERVAKAATPEAVSESEENYEDDYIEDFDEEVDEYINDVDDDDYNSDFDNPALLANRIEKPEFLTSKGNYDSSQEEDYFQDQYKQQDAEYSDEEYYQDESDQFDPAENSSPDEKLGSDKRYQQLMEKHGENIQEQDDYEKFLALGSSSEEEKAPAEKEDYDQFLTSSDEEAPITKEYTISLPVGKSSNKKITYTNTFKKQVKFDLQSSDNFFMVVKVPEVHAGPGEKVKFKLKFPPKPLPKKAEYILTVYCNSKLIERIKIIANYTA